MARHYILTKVPRIEYKLKDAFLRNIQCKKLTSLYPIQYSVKVNSISNSDIRIQNKLIFQIKAELSFGGLLARLDDKKINTDENYINK